MLRRIIDILGDFFIFTGQTFYWMARGVTFRKNWRLLTPQLYEVGYKSLPVIMITGAFVGMVIAVQAVEQFRAIGMEERMGSIVNLSVVRELGPVLAGIMLAGRIGGALTAELGTMNVTEQIDALRSMGVNPIRYLVAPRVLACFILTPALTLFADFTGAMGGWFVSVVLEGIAPGPYWDYTRQAVMTYDLYSGIIKSCFFGAALGLISCYSGFYCKPGAEGVGRACTSAFVTSFIVILAIDFVLAQILQDIQIALFGFQSLL
ncbi:MAG: ABC transporter permease [Phycisphaerales bacterium]|nr:ABC transporter permease [Phycisphaerales bacterium]